MAAIAVAVVAGGAGAEEAQRPDWIPSLALGVLVQGQSADAEGSTTWPECDDPIPEDQVPPAVILTGCYARGRPPASGDASLTTGIPDLRVGLLGPPLDFVSERVRPFVHAGWQYGWTALDTDVVAAQEGNFGAVIFPAGTNGPTNVAGIGTLFTTDVKNGWFAGLGFAVEVPWEGYDLRLLSSVDYYGERLSLVGASRRVAALESPASPGVKAEFRLEEVSGKDSEVMHALGPRVALEADIARSGSLVVSGFVEVGAFFFLGDRELVVPLGGDATGEMSIEKEAVTVHGGAGVRLYWSPK